MCRASAHAAGFALLRGRQTGAIARPPTYQPQPSMPLAMSLITPTLLPLIPPFSCSSSLLPPAGSYSSLALPLLLCVAVAGAGGAYWWHRRSGGDGDGSAPAGVELMGQQHRYTLMPGRETEPAPLLLSAVSAEPSPQRSQRTSPLRGPPSLQEQRSRSPRAVAAPPSSNGAAAGLAGAAAGLAGAAAAVAAAEAGLEAGEDHWAAVAAEAGVGDDWGGGGGDWGEDWEDLPSASSAAAPAVAPVNAPLAPASGAAGGAAAEEAAVEAAAPDPEAGNGWNRPASSRGADGWDEDW